jgi:acyl carrier protein
MSAQGTNYMDSSLKGKSRNRSSPLDGILGLLYESITDLNLQLPAGQRIEKSPATVLFGEGGKLDSLGLANFIVIAEQKLEDSYGCRIDLTEDDPFSQATGHFRTVESLLTYVTSLVSRQPEGSS